MKYLYILLFVIMFSCGNERIVELPEIKNAKITDIPDVSAAYVFYDETQPDSTEFNRRNLISTTNWLVNVDKRLSLKQAMPHIKYLQEKRRGAQMHKNDAARNYFTCNDTSIQNLGFIDFTDVDVELVEFDQFKKTITDHKKFYSRDELDNPISIVTLNYDEDRLIYLNKDSFKIEALQDKIKELSNNPNFKRLELKLNLSKSLSFQDYITFKSLILELKSDNITISSNETIY